MQTIIRTLSNKNNVFSKTEENPFALSLQGLSKGINKNPGLICDRCLQTRRE